jgi:uncharacterized protein (TIGR02453 family)
MLQAATVKFLKDLKKHNDREWFEKNRDRYDVAKADFQGLVQELINGISVMDTEVAAAHLQVKQCMFRINRDVRFSKNKSPYKTNFSCSISKKGKDLSDTAGYYFHAEPGQSFIAGGLYMPMPPALARIRRDISDNFEEWQGLVESKAFKKLFQKGMQDAQALVRPPKGYEADNPAIGYLKMKSFIVDMPFTDEELQSKQLVKKVVAGFQAIKPMIDFLNYLPE